MPHNYKLLFKNIDEIILRRLNNFITYNEDNNCNNINLLQI